MKHKRKLVKVTKDCIDTAGSCGNNCPIAVAINKPGIFVNSEGVFFQEEQTWFGAADLLGKLSRSAKRFIARYDDGLSVKPFNFYLTLTAEGR